jgi:hypothetical protein
MAGDISAAALISDAPSGGPPFEARPASEATAIQALRQAIEQQVRDAAAKDPRGVAHRDAHLKAHGFAKAEFRVLDGLAAELAVGLFAHAAAYSAWVRFSNAAEQPQADAPGDARGMAIKVMGVAASASGVQDFLMINVPAFPVRNAADYVDFQAAANRLAFFFPGLNPFRVRWRELWRAVAILRQRVSNPLALRYWSVTPFLYGAAACKFSARPVGAPRFADRTGANFMHDNLARTLEAGDAAFDICVQLRRGDMPIEDPSVRWSETAAPFVPVARLTIPRQDVDAAERRAFGERLSFTPWHGLEAHRPLGGINRVRRVVYEAISGLRHELNGEARMEPSGFQSDDPSGL